MTRTVLLNCPIKAEIRTVDSQSDLRILVMIRSEIILIIMTRSSVFVNHPYDCRPNWTPLNPITIINTVGFFLFVLSSLSWNIISNIQ